MWSDSRGQPAISIPPGDRCIATEGQHVCCKLLGFRESVPRLLLERVSPLALPAPVVIVIQRYTGMNGHGGHAVLDNYGKLPLKARVYCF